METSYKPTVDEIFIGAVVEYKGNTTTKMINSWRWHRVIVGRSHDLGKEIDFSCITKAINGNRLRMSYLTNEDLESEGWVSGLIGVIDCNMKGPYLLFSFANHRYEIHELGDRVFKGTIKNINELRKLQKQLGI